MYGFATMLLLAVLLTACNDEPVSPHGAVPGPQSAVFSAQDNATLAVLRQVTARYHNRDAALTDGFVLLHPCEQRPGEGPVGAVYVNFARLMDGVIDPHSPDALIYEPSNGREKLVGVEFALPYALWDQPEPPTFMGAEFQREDEFGVFALHVWVWRNNPEGMFGESNPRVSCGA